MLTITAHDRHVEQRLDTVGRLADTLAAAGIEYRVIGAVAVFLHGLITPEIESSLSDVLRSRLRDVRAAECLAKARNR